MVKQIAGFHIQKGRRLTGSNEEDQAVLLVTPTVIRLQRLTRTHKRGADIWLALSWPMRLKKVIPNIEGVTLVSEPVG